MLQRSRSNEPTTKHQNNQPTILRQLWHTIQKEEKQVKEEIVKALEYARAGTVLAFLALLFSLLLGVIVTYGKLTGWWT